MHIALVTSAGYPELDPDTRSLIEPLAARGVLATPAVWDDPSIEWAAFDLAVVRSCWDYHHRRDEFLAWAARVPRLANAYDVLAWNTDKGYLRELADRGVSVVPTTWIAPHETWTPGSEGQWVIKPAVSASAHDSSRYQLGDEGQRRLAAEHVRRLQAQQRMAMLQPYLGAIDAEGETSLMYLNGAFSHAVRRPAVLSGLTGGERSERRQPSRAQLAMGAQVLAAIPPAWALLYARVDLVPGADGAPILMELELTEPSLFLASAAGAAERFADVIASWKQLDRMDGAETRSQKAP